MRQGFEYLNWYKSTEGREGRIGGREEFLPLIKHVLNTREKWRQRGERTETGDTLFRERHQTTDR